MLDPGFDHITKNINIKIDGNGSLYFMVKSFLRIFQMLFYKFIHGFFSTRILRLPDETLWLSLFLHAVTSVLIRECLLLVSNSLLHLPDIAPVAGIYFNNLAGIDKK